MAQPAAASQADDAVARKHSQASRGWEINLGALAIGSEGLALKPQMLFGAQIGNLSVEAGLHDVRDGLKVSAQAEAAMSVQASGMSVQELHNTIEFDTIGFREALDAAKDFFSSNAGRLGEIAKTIGISPQGLESALAGKCTKASCTPMTLKVTAEVGIGASAHVCLGWKDTQGYNMVGVGGGASAAFAAKMSAFAGRHLKKRCAKILLGITNFKFEYVFPIGSLEGRCQACEGSGSVKGTGFMGVGKAQCTVCGGRGQIKCSLPDEQDVSDAVAQGSGMAAGSSSTPVPDLLA